MSPDMTVSTVVRSLRIRSVLRLPRRRDASLLPGTHVRQPSHRAPSYARGGLPPDRGSPRSLARIHPRASLHLPSTPLLPVPGVWRDTLATPCTARLRREVPRAVRRGLGCGPPGVVRTPARARRHSARHGARAAQSRASTRGRTSPRTSGGIWPASKKRSRGSLDDHGRADRSAHRVTSTRWASSMTRSCC